MTSNDDDQRRMNRHGGLHVFHRHVAAAAVTLTAGLAHAQTEVPFTLDWKLEGPAAPYFVAIDNGHFADAGLEVEIAAGDGSVNTIPKIATGAFPIGFGDINSVIKFLDQNPGAPGFWSRNLMTELMSPKPMGKAPVAIFGMVLTDPSPAAISTSRPASAKWPLSMATK